MFLLRQKPSFSRLQHAYAIYIRWFQQCQLVVVLFGVTSVTTMADNHELLIEYSRITSKENPSFCMTSLSASSTNGTALLTQSHDCRCYISRRILAPPPLWLQKHTDLRAHDFAHFLDLWHKPIPAKITCAWRWRPCLINPAINEGHGVVISRKKALTTRFLLPFYSPICPIQSLDYDPRFCAEKYGKLQLL